MSLGKGYCLVSTAVFSRHARFGIMSMILGSLLLLFDEDVVGVILVVSLIG